jgi:hypothetical protein
MPYLLVRNLAAFPGAVRYASPGMRMMNTLGRRSRWAVPAVALALGAWGCGDGDSGEVPKLRFDDLGGGSSIIMVYPGPGGTDAEKQYNGTFKDGDRWPVVCHATGRLVMSHPDVGERARQTTDWYQLAGGPPVQYATGTYGFIEPEGAAVPECPPASPVPVSSAPVSRS